LVEMLCTVDGPLADRRLGTGVPVSAMPASRKLVSTMRRRGIPRIDQVADVVEEMSPEAISRLVQQMKATAFRYPWTPRRVVPRRHFHRFPNGLSICFTQDVLPMTTFWHLSLARERGLTEQELRFWPRAFFDADPEIDRPGELLPTGARHFFWRKEL